MNFSIADPTVSGILLLAAGIAAIIAVVVTWMIFSHANLTGKTCSSCGAQLPVLQLPVASKQEQRGDWICDKCGSRFDRRGKARNQIA